MTYLRFFVLFSLTYVVGLAVAGILVSLAGLNNAGSLNTPLLFGVSFWWMYRFSETNARVVQGKGKWKLVLLVLLADVLIFFLLGAHSLLNQEKSLYYLLLGLLIVAPVHLLLLVATCYFVKKSIVKKHPEWAPG
ncbi:hypothetical protein IT774_07315 [Salinimonas marina]|uniref:Transmembrane protein n=1 Tax=Salinimonas marina TaxID=2785918 RepID=A0A7S9DZQ4_9ALTE|nr:ABZJ_00895 family protein [Salinimonas marina]QPG06911.1 hypothetical protein IT774_07315 [Salinimonas marina]